jgi:hypothetical protein
MVACLLVLRVTQGKRRSHKGQEGDEKPAFHGLISYASGAHSRLIEVHVLLLVRVIARDDGAGRLGCAQIGRLMRHIGRNENKIARFVDGRFV